LSPPISREKRKRGALNEGAAGEGGGEDWEEKRKKRTTMSEGRNSQSGGKGREAGRRVNK